VVFGLDRLDPLSGVAHRFWASRALRFHVQIKVLWQGAQEHKGLDDLVPSTCEEPAYRVLYLIASQPESDEFPIGPAFEAVLSSAEH
jgi:hypothetical protein